MLMSVGDGSQDVVIKNNLELNGAAIVIGNIQSLSSISCNHNILAGGNITANGAFIGDGSQLTGVSSLPESNAASRGSALTSDGEGGSFWAYMGATGAAAVDNSQWRYRSVFTHGYLAAGYKGSNAWRSINKTWHTTDTTLYCGEQLHSTQSYTNGVWSDLNGYIITNGGHGATGRNLSSYSLHNGTIRMHTGDGYSSAGVAYGYVGHDPKNEGLGYGSAGFGGNVGGMQMSTSRKDGPASTDMKGQSGWLTGGGSSVSERLHMPTETMYVGSDSGMTGIGDGANGELYGWMTSGSNNKRRVQWSNSTWATWGNFGTGDGHCKILSTKHGHHYVGTGNNVTIGKAKFSDASGSQISTFNKVRSYGEENPEDGQDHGYLLGHYDGQQNNHTIKQSYTSDVEVTMGPACMPKGHYGQSSGACSSAAASVTASNVAT
jgi:hypothetical protein